jgi:LytS/YehU family sensor histidine kinase
MEYLTILAFLVSAEYYRRSREDQEEKEQLNHALDEAKLHALRAQLNPHFLFNALNSVSCLVYNDPAAADRMLANIANLLRLTLARDNSKEVRLLEEVDIAEEYLEIQKIRFGPRLKMEIDIADDVLDACVPNMLLQPLVENACIHGVARTRGECRLEIKARAESGQLFIGIYNDGPPISRDWNAQPGIGLRNTRERLHLLYGSSSDLELVNVSAGVCLSVRLPLLFERGPSDHNEVRVGGAGRSGPTSSVPKRTWLQPLR